MALIRPFIPAKDFALSRTFYAAIGFAETYLDDNLAILEQDGAGILLQNGYAKEWADNCMAQLFVADLDGWWTRTEGLAERFGVKKPRAPKMQDWGLRVGFLWDTSGVLWHTSTIRANSACEREAMIHRAACHCGTVRFEVDLPDGFDSIRRCNCSMCRMRGAVAVSATLAGLRIVAGAEALASYRFNTRAAEHFFCSRCGIYTHHQRRSNPEEYGVNVACLDGVSPFDFAAVPVTDGVHHSKDDPQGGQLVGTLRYEPAPPSPLA